MNITLGNNSSEQSLYSLPLQGDKRGSYSFLLLRLRLCPHALKEFTDNADATELFFHGFFYSFMICLRLPGAMIVTDYLLLAVIPRRIGANAIRSKSNIKW